VAKKPNLTGDILYEDLRFVVTTKLFRTPRQTYQISRIEKTAVYRSFLPFCLPFAFVLVLFAWVWQEYLYSHELIGLLFLAAGLAAISLTIGTLSIYSKALGETAAFDLIWRLKRLRNAVDEAIDRYEDGVNEPLRGLMQREERGSGNI
jgi:hypothetical protein